MMTERDHSAGETPPLPLHVGGAKLVVASVTFNKKGPLRHALWGGGWHVKRGWCVSGGGCTFDGGWHIPGGGVDFGASLVDDQWGAGIFGGGG